MKDRFFLDTNVLVYANDRSARNKHDTAKRILLEGLASENLVLSTQVLGEFFVTVTRKIEVKLPVEDAVKEILLLRAADIVPIDFDLTVRAVEFSVREGLSYWDSLIVAAAQKAQCAWLVSEDMGDGRSFGSVTIRNPFRLE
jgi:predicted nucleic acid-binding protein